MPEPAPFILADTGWGTVITIVVFAVLSAISNAIQRKREKQADEWPDASIPGAPAPTAAPQKPLSGWEEELRRLLKDPSAPPEPPVPREMPPAIPLPQQNPAPVSIPPAKATRPVRPALRTRRMAPMDPPGEEGEGNLNLPTLAGSTQGVDTASRLPQAMEERFKNLTVALGRMTQAKEAVASASQIGNRARQHVLAGASSSQLPAMGSIRSLAPSARESLSRDAREATALLRERSGTRQALIASLILGPPKAMGR